MSSSIDTNTPTPTATDNNNPTPPENPLLRASNPLVSDLEQEVLDEYARLLGNVNKLSDKVSDLAGSPTSLTLDGLRLLERKTATVCTLLKASVYSIVLQQQIFNESEEQQQQEQQQEGGELGQEQFEEDEYYTRGGGRGGFDGDVTFEG